MDKIIKLDENDLLKLQVINLRSELVEKDRTYFWENIATKYNLLSGQYTIDTQGNLIIKDFPTE